MTKQEELSALDAFRKSLPESSYLRPWIDNVFAEVQDAILSDILPMATYAACQKQIDAMCNAAEQYKNAAMAKGMENAAKTEREAKDKADSALIETLPVVHTLNMETLEGHFKTIESAAGASAQEAGAMLADYAKRRNALVVLSLGFVFVMGLLIAKLAFAMKDHGHSPPK